MAYEQTTYETCLACSILACAQRFRNFTLTKKLEFACILHSMNYSKWDFASGHVDFVRKKYGLSVERTVEFSAFARYLAKKKLARVTTAPITLRLIDKQITHKPIICVDMNTLFPLFHYPHWIVILGTKGKHYSVYDPGDGKVKKVPRKTIQRGIQLLRKHLLMSPQLIVVTEKSSVTSR